MEKISISLSEKDISRAIKELNKLKSKLNDLSMEIALEIAEQTRDKAKENYERLTFNKTHPEPSFEVKQEGSKAIVSAVGTGVLFDEYGTGLGATRPHIGTTKAFISSGYSFWFMPKDVANLYNAANTYTTGHDAGNFMYNADIWMRDNYKKIAKEKVDDVLSKL